MPDRSRSSALIKSPPNKKLSEQIYERLRKDIIECVFDPGALLEEAFVTERYQIGRTPFREACHWLEAEGLLEIVPHRGCFVASFSNKDITDLFETRLMIEPPVAELAAQRSDPSQLGDLVKNLTEAVRIRRARGVDVALEVNWNSMDFHVQVAVLTQNQELQGLVENLQTKLMRIIMFTARRTPQNYPLDSIHPEIFDAIRKQKPSEARRWMIKDLERAREWVRDFGR
jgi:DNA-binding GntR family transcriptional regulator